LGSLARVRWIARLLRTISCLNSETITRPPTQFLNWEPETIRSVSTRSIPQGGDRRELWWFVRKGKLGLIGKSEVDSSAVEEQDTKSLYTAGSS
jgi:hypothetical protein